MKKSFTLLELLISISIFSIITVFLYKTLDQTKYSNLLFLKKQEILKESNHLHNIFLEDVSEASSISPASYDKNKNAIVKFETKNSYHNPFFNNITYLINSSKELIRIESQTVFNHLQPIEDAFFSNAFIDVLVEDMEYFEFKNDSNNNYIFIIKQKNKERLIYNTFLVKSTPKK